MKIKSNTIGALFLILFLLTACGHSLVEFPGKSGSNNDTAPLVVSTLPAGDAANIAIGTTINATFDKAMKTSTVNAATFILKQGTTVIPGTVTYNSGNFTATLTPKTVLTVNTTYTATIKALVADLAGNFMAADYVWSFSTAATVDTTAPLVTLTSPANGDVSVAPNRKLVATFNEEMDGQTIIAANVTVTGPGGNVPGAVVYSPLNLTMTFTPTANLAFDSSYTVTIKGVSGVADLAGNFMAANYTWSFSTAATVDATAPLVTLTSPANADLGVAPNRKLIATFNEEMDGQTIIAANVTVTGPGGNVPGTVSYSALNLAMTFTPTANLAFDSSYTVTIKGVSGVADLAGNFMAANYSWSFSTATTVDATAPLVTLTSPANADLAVAPNRKLIATFNEEMDGQTIIAANVTVTGPGGNVPGTVSYSALNLAMTFTPTANLALDSSYTVTIKGVSGVADLAGNFMAANYIWSFSTAAIPDTAKPRVTSTSPFNLDALVSRNATITATFSEHMINTSILAAGVFTVKQGLTEIAGVVTYDALNNTATFTPTSPLALNTTYTALITVAATDLDGNPLESGLVPNPWTFATTSAPKVEFTVPFDQASNVPITQLISATFTKPMRNTSILAAGVFTVKQGLTAVAGVVTYDAPNNTATFTPTSPLALNTTYTAHITVAATDLDGNPLESGLAPNPWTLTTVAGPKVKSITPLDQAGNTPVDQVISATFTKPMRNTSILAAGVFTVKNGLTEVAGTVAYDAINSRATFTPFAPLAVNTTYTALITAAATDLDGNPLESGLVPNPWIFTTVAVNLGLLEQVAIAATAGVTNTATLPITTIYGNVALDPISGATCNHVLVDAAGGFGLCGSNNSTPIIYGTVISPLFPDAGAASGAIKADLLAAFLSITPPAGPPAVGLLGGATIIPAGTTLGALAGSAYVQGDNYFVPGVYQSLTSMLITDDLTLDGLGDPNARFVFQSSSTLGTAAGAASPGVHTRILLINGARASNVWWQVGSSATLGTYSEFQGNILASESITMSTGASSCGRLLAGAFTAGAFVFDSNIVAVPGNGCAL